MTARLPLRWLLLAVALPIVARAQTMGPNACMTCHDHQPERIWAVQKDGPPPHGHVSALKELDTPKAKAWLRKLGAADPYNPAAGCIRCHATVVGGDAVAGVTCESCHGPGAGYAVVHQDKGAYRAAVAAGMFDTRARPEGWVRLCVSCHVVDDRRVIQAGHPGGDTFDAVKQVATVVHWPRTEPDAAVAAAGRAAVAAAIARRHAPVQRPLSVALPPAVAPDVSTMKTLASGQNMAVEDADIHLLSIVEALLRRGAYTARPLSPIPAGTYSGPDAALLKLQQDIINLALHALNTPPAPPSVKKVP